MALTSQFEIEPLIIQAIKDLALTDLTVEDETAVANLADVSALLPACILFAGPGQYSAGTDGRVQTETQFWQITVLVKHFKTDGVNTTASRAGAFLLPILKELVGKKFNADLKPLEIVDRSQPEYHQGYAQFPVILKTSFNIEAV